MAVRTNPEVFGSVRDYISGLRRLKERAEVGYRELERRAAVAGEVLPRSTLTSALRRDALPREELVAAFVRACGCEPGEVARWLTARRRLVGAQHAGPPTRLPVLGPITLPRLAPAPLPVRVALGVAAVAVLAILVGTRRSTRPVRGRCAASRCGH